MSNMDIEHLRKWIGNSIQEKDVVTSRMVREFDAMLSPNLFEFAEGSAPLCAQWLLSPAIVRRDKIGADGHPQRGDFLPPVELPRRMWAGGKVEHIAPLKVGDEVTRTSTIADVQLKTGKSGSLCFVTVNHVYTDSAGGVAIRERQDIVYRDAPAVVAGAATAAPVAGPTMPSPDTTWTLTPDSLMLFRYSALTFNGHRIHYDMPYVTDVEGYAGLVVHGPMQATLLINLAATVLGKAPDAFEYRGLAPAIAGRELTINAAKLPDGTLQCWTSSAGGVVHMQGTAS